MVKSEVFFEIQKLLDNGMIILSKIPWASLILIIKKKDRTNKVIINYRKLNNITKKTYILC